MTSHSSRRRWRSSLIGALLFTLLLTTAVLAITFFSNASTAANTGH